MNFKITKNTYPDGSFYPVITEFYPRLASPETLTYRINSYEDLWFLRQVKDVLDHNNCKCHLTIPCLFDAQADKRFNTNESHNLALICRFINEMKWESVSIFHPHNPEVVEALIDNVKIIDNWRFVNEIIPLVFTEWRSNNDDGGLIGQHPYLFHGFNKFEKECCENSLILMSTDAGGFKPLMKLADKLNWRGEVHSASKSRKWEDDKSKLIQEVNREDFGGKDILIIDDLCIKGGTFIGLAELLRKRNVGRLFLAVSHITIKEPDAELWNVFDQVFTTNSKGLRYWILNRKRDGMVAPSNLKVIKLFEEENENI